MTQPSVQLASIGDDKSCSQHQQLEITILQAHPKPCPDLLNEWKFNAGEKLKKTIVPWMNGVLTLPWNCFKGPRKDYITIGIPLFEASIKGDWETTEKIIGKRKELVRYSITENGETALHVAASATSTKQVEKYVEKLMTYMEAEDLELENHSSNTALCLAAEAGNVKIVKMMVEKNRGLVAITGNQGMKPLHMAALFRNYDVVKYLYKESQKFSDDCCTPYNLGWLLLECVETDMFDIALEIVKEHPELGSSGSVLELLARKTDVFAETKSNIFMGAFNWVFTVICRKMGAERESEAWQLLSVIWQNIMEKSVDEIDVILRGPPDFVKQDERPASDKEDQTAATTSEDLNAPWQRNEDRKYSSQILFVAAEMGNTRFIAKLVRLHPSLMYKLNDDNQSIFHTAVKNRHEGIYNMLYEMGPKKDPITPLKDKNGNNMLHLAGKCAKKKQLDHLPGVAFQLQRELLWFKDVEEMLPPSCRDERNEDGLTPHELFTMEHKEQFKHAEEWIKGTASQCMVVAAFIVPVMVGAAYTVPSGYNQNDGIPIFSRKVAYMVFLVANAISFFSALSSVIMFISILTSRYAERDLCESLPNKLMLGLATLLLAITTTMVSFASRFFVPYHNDRIWIPLLGCLFATLPVLFVSLLYPLFKDVIILTYGSRYLFRLKKHVLYENHRRFAFASRFFSRGTPRILKRL